ncbi:MAG: hypothetical protein A3B86_04040 [Candidatus Yanofskybacteria bacterium RIFCSPHIGHO2_02_FULL_38_22b]|uniref:Putative 3-methyladenine DNA glycosylase n=1 Tax=Candidatus Yanofskybacteria bacterium RIFCSPHIGHO2_02_FULL_38_22b TaxID=1802673 RepID=A0A1F8EZG0_9BACT|nr:MAG: hypothetical protein A2816_01810 [Candidatus Yanofskybacteria bacterium RIFCSPHIGHO2_01_FULL_39_44]OGN06262.1 MAG: hypothetical protein A3B86_04040 [Candidatus Yanofskybacteria bacterium RIFCSPHIGHO2_02_FULL_38_22b]OGN19682.1 MAG: hypothetical protein A2910_03775 [Candidatus Yanofskybacteria bacterium RIFCSPLOWO2_01_FULL_39_28]
MRLKVNFFNRDTVIVAKELLGKYLCRKIGNKVVRVKITETEAYCGIKDKACHASKGLTPRTKIMFGHPGYAYVYMIYGMYYCLNLVTREAGCPEAVLIRGGEKLNGLRRGGEAALRGPGKLCLELKIDKKLNGMDIFKSKELWIENGEKVKPSQIKKGKRIGIDYAGKWKDKLWRFWVNPFK